MNDHWIPEEEWRTIVANVPIVSVDLLVRYEGGLVLGKRTNEPAKGEWFVPGGTVRKGETRREAVHRIAEGELGLTVEIVESLGVFEHIYDTSDVEGVDSKHYLANGYVVDAVEGELAADEQHQRLRSFSTPPRPLHDHVRSYVEASRSISEWI